MKVEYMVEKPAVKDAPSRMAILGRYVITPDVFDVLSETKPGKGGEIQLTDALRVMSIVSPFMLTVFPAVATMWAINKVISRPWWNMPCVGMT